MPPNEKRPEGTTARAKLPLRDRLRLLGFEQPSGTGAPVGGMTPEEEARIIAELPPVSPGAERPPLPFGAVVRRVPGWGDVTFESWDAYIMGAPSDDERRSRREEAIEEAQKGLAASREDPAALYDLSRVFPNVGGTSGVLSAAMSRTAKREPMEGPGAQRLAAWVRFALYGDPMPVPDTREDAAQAMRDLALARKIATAVKAWETAAPYLVFDARSLYTAMDAAGQEAFWREKELGWNVSIMAGEALIMVLMLPAAETLAPLIARQLGVSLRLARFVSNFTIWQSLSVRGARLAHELRTIRPGEDSPEARKRGAYKALRETFWNLIWSLPGRPILFLVAMVIQHFTEPKETE